MLESKLHIPNISENSEKLVELFFDCYAPKSKATYSNAIRRLRELVDKHDFTELNYDDLMSCIREYETTNILPCITSLFQFLYCNDYLKNTDGFEKLYWNKNERKEYFNKLRIRTKVRKTNFKPSLSIVDIEKLITFCENVSTDDVDNLRLAFCFYLMFYEGIDASTLKEELDANNYYNGYFKIGDQEYLLIDKYISLFEHLKDRTYSKFRSLNLYISLLGQKVGITGLTPKIIKSARKNSMFMCPECGEHYLYFTENWKSINNKVVCLECAERIITEGHLKKTMMLSK